MNTGPPPAAARGGRRHRRSACPRPTSPRCPQVADGRISDRRCQFMRRRCRRGGKPGARIRLRRFATITQYAHGINLLLQPPILPDSTALLAPAQRTERPADACEFSTLSTARVACADKLAVREYQTGSGNPGRTHQFFSSGFGALAYQVSDSAVPLQGSAHGRLVASKPSATKKPVPEMRARSRVGCPGHGDLIRRRRCNRFECDIGSGTRAGMAAPASVHPRPGQLISSSCAVVIAGLTDAGRGRRLAAHSSAP